MMHLTRRDDWRARLAAEMDRQRREPFVWGTHDCAIGFAAAIVEAITGEDLARDYRGKYTSPKGAAKVLLDAGAETLADFAALHLPECPPAFARIGDLGIVASDGPVGQAICMVDASTLILQGPDGHHRAPREMMIRAFRVGE